MCKENNCCFAAASVLAYCFLCDIMRTVWPLHRIVVWQRFRNNDTVCVRARVGMSLWGWNEVAPLATDCHRHESPTGNYSLYFPHVFLQVSLSSSVCLFCEAAGRTDQTRHATDLTVARFVSESSDQAWPLFCAGQCQCETDCESLCFIPMFLLYLLEAVCCLYCRTFMIYIYWEHDHLTWPTPGSNVCLSSLQSLCATHTRTHTCGPVSFRQCSSARTQRLTCLYCQRIYLIYCSFTQILWAFFCSTTLFCRLMFVFQNTCLNIVVIRHDIMLWAKPAQSAAHMLHFKTPSEKWANVKVSGDFLQNLSFISKENQFDTLKWEIVDFTP